MPEPPASSWPDQLTVKLAGLKAGRAVTLLVGGAGVDGVDDRRRVQGALIGQAGLEDDRGLGVDHGARGVGGSSAGSCS